MEQLGLSFLGSITCRIVFDRTYQRAEKPIFVILAYMGTRHLCIYSSVTGLGLFRANTFNDATAMINGVFRDWGRQYTTASLMGFVLMLAALALFIILEILAYKKVITITESENNPYDGKNLAFLVITLLSISLLGQSGAQFVYFKF